MRTVLASVFAVVGAALAAAGVAAVSVPAALMVAGVALLHVARVIASLGDSSAS